MRNLWQFAPLFIFAFSGYASSLSADDLGSGGARANNVSLLKMGCTLDLIDALVRDGPLTKSDKIMAILNQQIHISLKKQDVGDPAKTWMAEDYDLTDEDDRKYHPLRVRVTIAKRNLPFDQSTDGRRISYLTLWAWGSVCPDNFGKTAALLRTRYTPNIYSDFPGTATATYSVEKFLTRFTIEPMQTVDKILSLTVETWESE